jgi:hypothetical protein
MINTVTTSVNNNVIVVTAPGPVGPVGPIGPIGPKGLLEANSGTIVSPFLIVSGSAIITGSLTISGSNTFINIGPSQFTGSTGILGNLLVQGTSSALLFSGSGANLFNIPASGITGLNLSRIATGSISASALIGVNSFIINSGSTNLFTVSNIGAGIFNNGLIISGSSTIKSNLNVSGSSTLLGGTVISSSLSISGSATLNNSPIITANDLTLNQITSGNVTASVSNNNTVFALENNGTDLMTVSSSGYVSASGYIGDGSKLSNVGIIYDSGSNPLITSIEVADFDNDVAVTFINGKLKFIFGTPVLPSLPSLVLNGFDTDRFNNVFDEYNVTASWNIGGYTLESAKLYYTTTGELLSSITTGNSFNIVQNTTGSGQSYRVEVTASSPLDGNINRQSSTQTGNLNKSLPTVPTIQINSENVQLGIASLQIEEGANGEIQFASFYGSNNGWFENGLTTNPPSSPQTISTPSNNVIIAVTASYLSPLGTNLPQIPTSRSSFIQYSRIVSLRFGATLDIFNNASQLQDLDYWDTTIGGNVGLIRKGTTSPSGQTITITWTGDKYHYIIYNSSLPNLSVISSGGLNTISLWDDPFTLGKYKIYRTTQEQAGGLGKTSTYVLT